MLSLGALVLLIYQKKRESPMTIKPVELVFLLFIGIFFVGITSPFVTVLINLLVLAIGILTIREGAIHNHFGILNYGLLIVTVLIFCRFFDTNLSFIFRGLLFVIVGLGFFYANYWMSRRKRKRKAEAKAEERLKQRLRRSISNTHNSQLTTHKK